MYLLITIIRNFLFDLGIIKSKKHEGIVVLCVGNIRVGGTGKTPMIEYLIRNLQDKFDLAVISLGYKRKSKGLKEVLETDSAIDVGDEPLQMKRKFPKIPFFVNKNRNIAIDYIKRNLPNTKLILLDDAYQYRKTKSDITILLTEYLRPYFKDFILPFGRLRERKNESKRADYIIVTKCPDNISNENKLYFKEKLSVKSYQQVFFSTIKYNNLFINPTTKSLLFIAAIDNPIPALQYLQNKGYDVVLKKFNDHHSFNNKDIINIKKLAENKEIITTEKDAVKLQNSGLQFKILQIENEIDGNFIQILKQQIRNKQL